MINLFFKHPSFFKWLLPLFAFLLYANTIQNDYNIDDELVTINHRNTSRGLSAFNDILNQFYYEDASGYKYDYRPVTHLSFAFEHELLGESPHISHFINVLIYALNCWLLFFFLSVIFPERLLFAVWLTTLLFVFHPIHTEVVASIKSRDELLALLFSLLAGITFQKAILKNHWMLGGLALFFLVLALLSKISIAGFLLFLPLTMIFSGEKRFLIWFITTIFILLTVLYTSFFSLDIKLLLLFILPIFFILIREIFIGFSSLKWIFNKINSSLKWIFNKIKLVLIKLLKPIKNWIFYFTNGSEYWFFESPIIFSKYKLSPLLFFLINSFLFLGFYGGVIIGLKDLSYICFLGILFGLLFTYSQFTLFLALILLLFTIPGLGRISMEYEIKIVFSIFISFYLIKSELKFKFLATLSIIILYVLSYFIIDLPLAIKIVVPVFTLVFLSFSFVSNRYFKSSILFFFLIFSSSSISQGLVLAFGDALNMGGLFILPSALILWHIRQKEVNVRRFLGVLIFVFVFIVILIKLVPDGFRENVNSEIIYKKESLSEKETLTNPEKVKETYSENYFGLVDLSKQNRELNFLESPINYTTPLNVRVATGMDIFVIYLKKLILPNQMGFYYGYSFIKPRSENHPSVVFGTITFLILTASAFYFTYKKKSLISFGLWLILITISPLLNIISSIPGVIGDRFLFVPSIGFSILMAYPIYKAIGTKWQKLAYFSLGGILVFYGFITVQRNTNWKNHLVLMRHDIKYLDKSAQAHNLLASNLMKYSFEPDYSLVRGEMHKVALYHFKKSIDIYPKLMNTWFDYARVAEILGDFEEAKLGYRNAINLDSTFTIPYYNIANIYSQSRQIDSTIYFYYMAIDYEYDSGKENLKNTIINYLDSSQNVVFRNDILGRLMIKFPYDNSLRNKAIMYGIVLEND